MRMLLPVAALAATCFSVAPADAAVTLHNLNTLIQTNGSVTSGDKLFSNFTYASTNDMPDANGVNVIPITDRAGNFGIRFQGGFLDTPLSHGPSDALITFIITVLDPNLAISAAHIHTAFGLQGQAIANINESFKDNDPDTTLNMFATPQSPDLTVTFPTVYHTLEVQKDILLYADNNDPTAQSSISMIDQSFSQVPAPEPASLSLLTLGALALLRRRKPGSNTN